MRKPPKNLMDIAEFKKLIADDDKWPLDSGEGHDKTIYQMAFFEGNSAVRLFNNWASQHTDIVIDGFKVTRPQGSVKEIYVLYHTISKGENNNE